MCYTHTFSHFSYSKTAKNIEGKSIDAISWLFLLSLGFSDSLDSSAKILMCMFDFFMPLVGLVNNNNSNQTIYRATVNDEASAKTNLGAEKHQCRHKFGATATKELAKVTNFGS